MFSNLSRMLDNVLMANVAVSLLLVIVMFIARILVVQWVNRSNFATEEMALRWRVRTRNALLLTTLLGLTIIWATELQTLALSAVAIAAAIVIATKELIMCFGGGILRATTESFTVGDRIEVDGVRGDVIHYGFMTTTVLEIGPNHQRTGRAVVLPNSILLASPVVNESFTERYVLHTFSVPIDREAGWHRHETWLLEAANAACEPFLEAAEEHIGAISRRTGLPTFSTAPRVTLQLPEAGKLNLMVRVPVPAEEKGSLEQEILKDYLDRAIQSAPTEAGSVS